MVEKRDREKHPEKQCGEPWVDWTRMRFPDAPSDEKRSDTELEAEFETDVDLSKPIPQLVCDFNCEIQKAIKITNQQQRHAQVDMELVSLRAQKHMVAMMAQVAIKNDKISNNILRLTKNMTWFTIAIFFLGMVSLLFSVYSYLCPARTLP
jgi:hypothetical protein